MSTHHSEMPSKRPRPLFWWMLLLALLLPGLLFLTSKPQRPTPTLAAKPSTPTKAAPPASLPAAALPTTTTEAPPEIPSTLADGLNAPSGNIRSDLEILQELLAAWQTNFPHGGNPVGDNAEITAALLGANPLKVRLLSPSQRALNVRGELCDRWGTPFFFHALSGLHMEIRSAGPDRRFGTPDDQSIGAAPQNPP